MKSSWLCPLNTSTWPCRAEVLLCGSCDYEPFYRVHYYNDYLFMARKLFLFVNEIVDGTEMLIYSLPDIVLKTFLSCVQGLFCL